ncbi:hypothetical protein ATO12_23205 [Aquimarina atlantica]|uniref:Uncharacterized protein n=1 Tax=Aquimarina atlantica TaxID=1317122 RepID=A0A023BQN2_9FLAO|nr:hypothetical protein ATO12_23205 [Aquimarina atlantica]
MFLTNNPILQLIRVEVWDCVYLLNVTIIIEDKKPREGVPYFFNILCITILFFKIVVMGIYLDYLGSTATSKTLVGVEVNLFQDNTFLFSMV